MRILELFAGIGACSTALKRLGIDLEIVDAVEIDKYAMASFNAIHGTNFEPQDITKWNKELKDIDIITHGSPCQDFSIAGKQAGGDIGSGTRSSLMYETIRIVGQVRPKYVLWENVKNILSAKHIHNFDAYIETMKVLGYNSYYQVLNAKDYGIPQNRERVYTISIRRDIDKGYIFPVKEELELRLKDMLEDEVDEKYYLSEKKIKKFNYNGKDEGIIGKLKLGNFDINNRVYSVNGFSWTLRNKQPDQKILIKNVTQKGYDEATDVEPFIVASRGRNPENPSSRVAGEHTEQRLEPNMKGTTNCITSVQKDNWLVERINQNAIHQQDLVQSSNNICRVIPAGTHGSTPHLLKTIVNEQPLRIRKLTPKECWRLMRI